MTTPAALVVEDEADLRELIVRAGCAERAATRVFAPAWRHLPAVARSRTVSRTNRP
jgi:hypothetical protein